jgi:hypothetical protein
MKMARVPKKRKQAKPPASPLAALLEQHLEALRVRNYSEHSVKSRQVISDTSWTGAICAASVSRWT